MSVGGAEVVVIRGGSCWCTAGASVHRRWCLVWFVCGGDIGGARWLGEEE